MTPSFLPMPNDQADYLQHSDVFNAILILHSNRTAFPVQDAGSLFSAQGTSLRLTEENLRDSYPDSRGHRRGVSRKILLWSPIGRCCCGNRASFQRDTSVLEAGCPSGEHRHSLQTEQEHFTHYCSVNPNLLP